MTRSTRPSARSFAALVITIIAITGTLSACGRYGSPVRVAPAADTTAQPIEQEISSDEAEVVDEETDRSQ